MAFLITGCKFFAHFACSGHQAPYINYYYIIYYLGGVTGIWYPHTPSSCCNVGESIPYGMTSPPKQQTIMVHDLVLMDVDMICNVKHFIMFSGLCHLPWSVMIGQLLV